MATVQSDARTPKMATDLISCGNPIFHSLSDIRASCVRTCVRTCVDPWPLTRVPLDPYPTYPAYLVDLFGLLEALPRRPRESHPLRPGKVDEVQLPDLEALAHVRLQLRQR